MSIRTSLLSVTIFLLLCQISNGQTTDSLSYFQKTNYFYNCKYCGRYDGKIDTVNGREANHIYVKLFLMQDSSYTYEIGGVFSGCRSMTFTGNGKWFADSGWLYFKENKNQNGTVLFVMQDTLVMSELNEPLRFNIKELSKHNDIDYDHALKITSEKSNCDKIYFRISFDCFEDWRTNFIQKTNCK